MAKRKTVEEQHLAFLNTYFSKKLAEKTLYSLLEENCSLEYAEGDLKACLEREDPERFNAWFDRYLSNQGRKTIWTAFRNIGYRKKNPRSEQELRKSVADQVMKWAETENIDNLNDAVLALLEGPKL